MTGTDDSCCNAKACVIGPLLNIQAPFIQDCPAAYFESLYSIAFFLQAAWTGAQEVKTAVTDLINAKHF